MLATRYDSWGKLAELADHKDLSLHELCADPDRTSNYTKTAADLHIDLSKNLLDDEVLGALLQLAQEAGVAQMRDKMFGGEHVNTTEDRAVLHVALRNPADSHLTADGHDVMPEITDTLARMRAFADKIRSKQMLGHTGKPITAVVNIGIGGSDLGPVMVYEALKDYSDRSLTMRFISNIDPTDFYENTQDLNPETTLFLVASKTFTTLETLTNATTAKQWLLRSGADESAISKHFAALSTNQDAVEAFGIDADNMFGFADWVGGRYSVLSSIGLSVMIAVGPENFDQLRAGAHVMDEHFRTTKLDDNLPVLLALIGIWNRNFLGLSSEAIIPYSQYLKRFPAYMQQGNMESNGKSHAKDGQRVDYDTGPLVWGEPGTNAQHSFFQLLHQGTNKVPVDFIGFTEPNHNIGEHHKILLANMRAQAEALAFGQSTPDEPHKNMEGNRPSTTITADKLTPHNLGQLLALYEHKIFVQGVVWGINSFDQWGVQLGKRLATDILNNNA